MVSHPTAAFRKARPVTHRTALHIFLGVLLWVVFGYYWHLVVQRPVTDQTRLALLAVGSIVAVITVFLVGWVTHNVRISRRLRRRSQRVSETTLPTTDFLGRTFVAHSEEQLQEAPYVEVQLVCVTNRDGTEEQKVFRVVDGLRQANVRSDRHPRAD